jgi:tellurite resistance protein TerC
MLGFIEITPWHWAGFILCVLIFLALDLGVFHRRARVIRFGEALAWSALWFALAMLFAGAMAHWRGREEATEFVAGYVIELSLSLVMRGAMIAVGAALIHQFDWVLYVFGAFLIFAGTRMFFSKQETVRPEKNLALRLAQKLFPISQNFDGQRFFTRIDGCLALTPLALVLLLVETTDLIFATDSIPAVFSVTRQPFIVFTSNIFAILGLRSLYFLLAGALGNFRYLKIGLSIVLAFVGAKMLVEPHGPPSRWFQIEIPTSISLLIVAAILLISIVLSVFAAQREKKAV